MLLEPLAQLVSLDLAEQHPEAAVDRMKRQIALVPTSVGHRVLLGDVYAAQRQSQFAQTAYLEAIELEPRLINAYLRLARLYMASGQYDQALAKKLTEVLTVDPKRLFGPWGGTP